MSGFSRTRAPSVSVRLPVYNDADCIPEAIGSVLNQTFGDFELLIQDNASPDATGEICCAYAARDHRVRCVRNPQNVGAAANYNLVFRRALGSRFEWAAHDERRVAVLDREPAVSLCFGPTRLINDGSPLGRLSSHLRVGQAS